MPPRGECPRADPCRFAGCSMVKIEQVDPRQDPEWDHAVDRHPAASVFHGADWARVLMDAYGHKPVFLRFGDESGTRALVPMFEVNSLTKGRRGVAVPFADFGGGLLFDGVETDAVRSRLETLASESGWRYLELRSILDPSHEPDVKPTYLGHVLPLMENPDDQFAQMDPAARRCVRRAEAAGLSCSTTTSWEGMNHFFQLHVRTRRAHGSPPQPLRFFRLIHRHLLEQGKGFVTLVEKAGRPVAGAVFLRGARNALFKFGASDPGALSDRPNHLAIWAGIRELIRQGVGELHFGRTTPLQGGLCRFKRSWGAQEYPIYYHRYLPREQRWALKAPETKAPGCAAFQFMPLPINRLAGRLLYPQFD